MMNLKNVLGGVALAALLASTVVAAAKTDYQKKFEGTTLNVLGPAMPQFAALWKLVPEFEKEYGIKVKVDETPFAQTREKTLVDMQQGTGRYDVFAVDVMWLAEYAQAGFLEPTMKYQWGPRGRRLGSKGRLIPPKTDPNMPQYPATRQGGKLQ
jgi:multiple sugar transport system substrate-binding protein